MFGDAVVQAVSDGIDRDFARIASLESVPDSAKIEELVDALRELSELCERSWSGAVVGKHIRNNAIRVLSKYPKNARAVTPATDNENGK